tara:strand:+ start:200 stop:550 length:351 start_codon:yes stop_codon:yes gene_type:complete
MTFEESWRLMLDVFERYHRDRDQSVRARTQRMHQFISSSWRLAEAFIVRFVERPDRTIKEKLELATRALADVPSAPYLELLVSVLSHCREIEVARSDWKRWSRRKRSMQVIYQPLG